MAKFRIGQEVICIVDGDSWCDQITGDQVDGPKKHEIVTVLGYPADEPAIFISGYPCDEGYYEGGFEEIMSASALEQELETIAIER